MFKQLIGTCFDKDIIHLIHIVDNRVQGTGYCVGVVQTDKSRERARIHITARGLHLTHYLFGVCKYIIGDGNCNFHTISITKSCQNGKQNHSHSIVPGGLDV